MEFRLDRLEKHLAYIRDAAEKIEGAADDIVSFWERERVNISNYMEIRELRTKLLLYEAAVRGDKVLAKQYGLEGNHQIDPTS